MFSQSYIFSQITSLIPKHELDNCISRYNGNYKVRSLSCKDQFYALLFGQISKLTSLRGISNTLQAHEKKLYHLGFRANICKSTLAKANEVRDWRIYRDLFYYLVRATRELYQTESLPFEFDEHIYVIDSSVIELSLGLYPWAHFEHTKSAVKIHLKLDLRGSIPTTFVVTTGKVHDVNYLDKINFEPYALYVFDRGYVDFRRLYVIEQASSYFVIRSKKNLSFTRLYSKPVDKSSGLRCDQTIKLRRNQTSSLYPERLRRVKYYDKETGTTYVYLTNNFALMAIEIVQIYKHRWGIETFFKWMKQHLEIQVLWGRTMNAVKTQICIAMCAYLLILQVAKRYKVEKSPHEILQILQVSLISKEPIGELLQQQTFKSEPQDASKQLPLGIS